MEGQNATEIANMPNMSLMYSSYTPTFGNLNFQISPSQVGQVNNTFGTIPYLSLEALIYQQQIQSQTNQANTASNQITGQQNVTGKMTVTDNTGNTRVQIGTGSF